MRKKINKLTLKEYEQLLNGKDLIRCDKCKNRGRFISNNKAYCEIHKDRG